jgi:DNA-binding transcriptional LysR family regulator
MQIARSAHAEMVLLDTMRTPRPPVSGPESRAIDLDAGRKLDFMELRRLRYFLSIAAEGSLGKASRTLGIAQPALGRQIQMMEAELGVELFRRVPKGMILTEEGEYLKQALEHPLELVNIALRNVKTHAVPVEASLVLGLPPMIAQTFGRRLITRIQRDLPNLRLKVTEGDSTKLATDLSRGLVDIALLIGIFPPDKIFHHQAMCEPLMLVVPAGSPEAERKSIQFNQLRGMPLILPGTQAGLRTQLARAELSSGSALDVALEIDSIDLRKEAVLAKLGYAILPQLAFLPEARRGELIGIPINDPELEQVIRFAVRPLWRVTRATYDAVERTIFGEWHAAVCSGDWPGKWLIDLDLVPSMATRDAEVSSNTLS